MIPSLISALSEDIIGEELIATSSMARFIQAERKENPTFGIMIAMASGAEIKKAKAYKTNSVEIQPDSELL